MIQEQFDKFSNRLPYINDYHFFNLDIVKRTKEDLLDQERLLKEKKIKDTSRGTRFYSTDPYTGEHVCIGRAVINNFKDDLYGLDFIHNKQKQWLLVDAYEAFVEYLKLVYACAGYINNNFWSLKDYGNISLNEIDTLNLSWFIEKSNKSVKSETIIKQFKMKIPELSTDLENNESGVDYNSRLAVIQHLRHIIVHRNGYIKDENIFIENILKSVGKYSNGNFDNKYTNYIKQFYCNCTKENKNIIVLTRNYSRHESNILTMVNDNFTNLLKDLASYSIIINKLLNIHDVTPKYFIKTED